MTETNEQHTMKRVDTRYGMTGGDLYVCGQCNSRVVTRPGAPRPACPARKPAPTDDHQAVRNGLGKVSAPDGPHPLEGLESATADDPAMRSVAELLRCGILGLSVLRQDAEAIIRESYATLVAEVERLRRLAQLQEDRTSNAEAAQRSLRTQLAAAKAENERLAREVDDLKADNRGLLSRAVAANEEAERLRRHLVLTRAEWTKSRAQRDQRIEELRRQLDDREAEVVRLTNDLTASQRDRAKAWTSASRVCENCGHSPVDGAARRHKWSEIAARMTPKQLARADSHAADMLSKLDTYCFLCINGEHVSHSPLTGYACVGSVFNAEQNFARFCGCDWRPVAPTPEPAVTGAEEADTDAENDTWLTEIWARLHNTQIELDGPSPDLQDVREDIIDVMKVLDALMDGRDPEEATPTPTLGPADHVAEAESRLQAEEMARPCTFPADGPSGICGAAADDETAHIKEVSPDSCRHPYEHDPAEWAVAEQRKRAEAAEGKLAAIQSPETRERIALEFACEFGYGDIAVEREEGNRRAWADPKQIEFRAAWIKRADRILAIVNEAAK